MTSVPPIIPDAPWWANALVLLMAVALPSIVSHYATKAKLAGTREKLDEAASDVAEVKEQVKNSHSSNLRHDLDLLSGAAHRTEAYVADLAESLKAIERSMERRYRLAEKHLEEAIEDHRQDIVDVRGELAEHVEQYHGKEKRQ